MKKIQVTIKMLIKKEDFLNLTHRTIFRLIPAEQ